MLDLERLKRSLGWYGIAWLAAFVIVLAGCLLAHATGFGLIEGANWLLAAAFTLLIGGVLGFLVMTAVRPGSNRTRIALVILALLLFLPLLWAPVLGAQAAAALSRVSIEYSEVYAGFRIIVGRFLYMVTVTVLGSPLVEAAWAFLQGLAAVVGVISALAQGWRMLKSLAGEGQAPA